MSLTLLKGLMPHVPQMLPFLISDPEMRSRAEETFLSPEFQENIEEYFKGILVDLVENGLSSAKDASHEVLISSLVNLTSRYFELNSIQELEMLLRKLLQCKMPYVDARGRPTLYQLSYKDIEKKLGVR